MRSWGGPPSPPLRTPLTEPPLGRCENLLFWKVGGRQPWDQVPEGRVEALGPPVEVGRQGEMQRAPFEKFEGEGSARSLAPAHIARSNYAHTGLGEVNPGASPWRDRDSFTVNRRVLSCPSARLSFARYESLQAPWINSAPSQNVIVGRCCSRAFPRKRRTGRRSGHDHTTLAPAGGCSEAPSLTSDVLTVRRRARRSPPTTPCAHLRATA